MSYPATPTKNVAMGVFENNGVDDIFQIVGQGGNIQVRMKADGSIDGIDADVTNGFPNGFPQFASYTFSVTAGVVSARNNTTGAVDFSGADAAVVVNAVLNANAQVGGLLYFKNGIYNLSSVTFDSTTSVYAAISIPPTGSATQVQWHFIGETETQILYASIQTNGVIFNLTSAAEAMAGAGNNISVVYQQSSASWGASNNNDVYFKNVSVRIPSNQRGKEVAFDLQCTVYSEFENCNADTAVAAGGQAGTNLPMSVAGNIGFRSNQSVTDECWMKNCWATGYYYGYDILTEHSHLLNCHASFCNTAARYGGGTQVVSHPSCWIHFQDIHCANGILLGANCGAGSRLDLIGYDIEILNGGTYTRVNNIVETNVGSSTGWVTAFSLLAGIDGGGLVYSPIFSSGGTNFRVDNSSKRYPAGILTQSTASATTTGTTKQTLATFTVVANSIFANNTGAVVRIKAWGITANNGNSKTVEIDFGGTAIASITSTANNGAIELEADVIVSGDSTQECIGKCDDGMTRTVTRTSPGISGTSAIAINLAATTGSSAGDFTFKGMTIEYLNGK